MLSAEESKQNNHFNLPYIINMVNLINLKLSTEDASKIIILI